MAQETIDAGETTVQRFVTSWQLLLVLGLITLVIGVLVLIWPKASLGVIAALFGAQLLVLGIVGVVRAIGGQEGTRALFAILGVLGIVVGILVLRHLVTTVVVLTILFGLTWLVSAVIDLIVVIADKRRVTSRGWAIALDVLTILAGIIILVWPAASLVFLTLLIGTWLVVWGVLTSINAFLVRRELNRA